MKSKLIGFIGAPGTGKTILACAMKEYFMLRGISTDVCTEYAREFVFKYGFPKHPYTQYRITTEQISREDLLSKGTNEYIFTDSPVWLGYIYSLVNSRDEYDQETKDSLSDMYGKFVIERMHRYHLVFHLKNSDPFDDGCKDMELNEKISSVLDGFVNSHRHILPIVDLDIPVKESQERKDFVWKTLNLEEVG